MNIKLPDIGKIAPKSLPKTELQIKNALAELFKNYEKRIVTWIHPVGTVDLKGMNLFWEHSGFYAAPFVNAKLSLYVNAKKDATGGFMFDDGQDWMLLFEAPFGKFPLFPRKYVQIGMVACDVFFDAGESLHVLVAERQGAGIKLNDCVYDGAKNAFKSYAVYDAPGINYITGSPVRT